MKTFIEIHALQNIPPSNVNRDDTGAPKTATYGGSLRGRVSSQSWKAAMRRDFNERVDPKDVGVRSKQVVKLLMDAVTERAPNLADSAEDLAVAALEVAGFKPAKKKKGEGLPELGYLMFVSRSQIESVADAIVANAQADKVKDALKAANVKGLLDTDHSIDMALFGRMVADAPDLNVDAACQVAHAIGVHEVVPEYDYYTAVDDVTREAEEAGAGMIGTVEFSSSTFYRYAALNMDQLEVNLGNPDAVRLAVQEFVRAFIESMPSGKQNTFANGTRPSAVLITIGTGQPVNLVGAFEEPVKGEPGYVKPAIKALASHAADVFDTWRQPERVFVCALSEEIGALAELAEQVSFVDLPSQTAEAAATLGTPS